MFSLRLLCFCGCCCVFVDVVVFSLMLLCFW